MCEKKLGRCGSSVYICAINYRKIKQQVLTGISVNSKPYFSISPKSQLCKEVKPVREVVMNQWESRETPTPVTYSDSAPVQMKSSRKRKR